MADNLTRQFGKVTISMEAEVAQLKITTAVGAGVLMLEIHNKK